MTTTLTATRSREMPRINLLPPEIHERVQLRRVQAGLGVGLALTVAAIAGVFLLASSQQQVAQEDLSASQAKGQALLAEQANYADVPVVYAEADATKVKLDAAMGSEVRMSFYLTDLSLLIPKNVWLTSLSVALAAPPAGPAGSAAAAAPAEAGQVTFSGNGRKHNDVAVWLEALATQHGTGNPYFSNSNESIVDEANIVSFASTATLTTAALSGRYVKKAGK